MFPLLYPDSGELTARGVARHLGITHDRVTRLIYAGYLPARSVGRSYLVRTADVEALKAAHPELVRPSVRRAA